MPSWSTASCSVRSLTCFAALVPLDRRRFYSTARRRACARPRGAQSRPCARRDHRRTEGDDVVLELSQQLIEQTPALLDLAMPLGCACAGAGEHALRGKPRAGLLCWSHRARDRRCSTRRCTSTSCRRSMRRARCAGAPRRGARALEVHIAADAPPRDTDRARARGAGRSFVTESASAMRSTRCERRRCVAPSRPRTRSRLRGACPPSRCRPPPPIVIVRAAASFRATRRRAESEFRAHRSRCCTARSRASRCAKRGASRRSSADAAIARSSFARAEPHRRAHTALARDRPLRIFRARCRRPRARAPASAAHDAGALAEPQQVCHCDKRLAHTDRLAPRAVRARLSLWQISPARPLLFSVPCAKRSRIDKPEKRTVG